MMDEEYIRKCLLLLQYALDKKGIPEDRYFIGAEGDEGTVDDKTCLIRAGGQWEVFYIERGVVRDRAIHEAFRDACNHFYWRLIRPETAWVFRNEWEQATGEQL